MSKQHFKTEDGKIVSIDLDRFISADIVRPSRLDPFSHTSVVVIRREVDNDYSKGSRIDVKTNHPEKLTQEIYEELQENQDVPLPHRDKQGGEEGTR